jgi:hypothetical protein
VFLENFVEVLPLDIEEITWKLRSLEKDENWINLDTCLEFSPQAKKVLLRVKINVAATLVLWFRLGRQLLLSDPFCASIKRELEEVQRIMNFEN